MAVERLLAPYLSFPGTAEEAINFYKDLIGGEITGITRFSDTPHVPNMKEEDRNGIMYMEYRLPDGSIMMASDHVESMGMPYTYGTNITLSIHPVSETEADRIYNGLSAGGKVIMPMQKTFWNAYFGMLQDKYGFQWMVNHFYPAEK